MDNGVKNGGTRKQLVHSIIIIIAAVAAVTATLLVLNYKMFFATPSQKLCGEWSRQRVGRFSGETVTEIYSFAEDGTGKKIFVFADGTKTEATFDWSVTKKKILVINGCVKYNYNADPDTYYSPTVTTARKYWYVTKDVLCIGENTSMTAEYYSKK